MALIAHLASVLPFAHLALGAQSCPTRLEGRCMAYTDATKLQVCGSGVWQVIDRGPWSCADGMMVPETEQDVFSSGVETNIVSVPYSTSTIVATTDSIQIDKLQTQLTTATSGYVTSRGKAMTTSYKLGHNQSYGTETRSTGPATASVYAASKDIVSSSASAKSPGYRSVAYMGNWDIYARKFTAQDLPADALTHIIYAFATMRPSGEVVLSDLFADVGAGSTGSSTEGETATLGGTLEQLFVLKQQHRSLKVLLSVGGWSHGYKFAAWVSTDAGLSTFAKSAVQLVTSLGLDGLDIDWEYPSSKADADRFVRLLKMVREEAQSARASDPHETEFVLTVACPAGPEHYRLWNIGDMLEQVDFWNLMAFDYAGSWDAVAGHQANVHKSTDDPASTPFNTDDAVQYYLDNGVDADRLLLGIPLYGRSFVHTQGPGQPFQGVGVQNGNGSWENGVWDYKALPMPAAATNEDDTIISSWSYDDATETMISYDTMRVVSLKLDYVKKRGLGGVMWWEISGDKARSSNESLVDFAFQFFSKDRQRGLDTSQNRLEYMRSPYPNVRDRSFVNNDA